MTTEDLITERVSYICYEIRRREAKECDPEDKELVELYKRLNEIQAIVEQRRITEAQRQLANATIAATEAQMAETKRLADEKDESEHKNFWLRRLITTLTVANGAGLVTSLTALTREPVPNISTCFAIIIVTLFAGGMIIMGGLELWLSSTNSRKLKRHSNLITDICSMFGLAFFVVGLFLVTVAAFDTFHFLQAQAKQQQMQPTAMPSIPVIPSSENAPPQSPASR